MLGFKALDFRGRVQRSKAVVAVFEVNPPQNIAIAALPYGSVAVFTSYTACSSESAGFCSGRSSVFSPLARSSAVMTLPYIYHFLGLFSLNTPSLQERLVDSSKSSARSWIIQVTYHRAIDRRRHIQSSHFYTNVDLEDVTRELGDTRCNRR